MPRSGCNAITAFPNDKPANSNAPFMACESASGSPHSAFRASCKCDGNFLKAVL